MSTSPQPIWSESASQMSTTITFADFAEAFGFVTRVALLAQERQHHPDIAISWNKVTLALSSHDAGGTVTAKDRDLAVAIDALLVR
ncbi:MAG: pterin-4-alpha-carbinolamine dehydratase [Ilumatobacteraceae bacterium]|jgi:4a-hydroxytetrahydrobiopterin dehydratase|nr:pterin-4-alpha-carbinolamine dehydratase [Ilumatobacteraceae bacterium]